MKNLNFFSGKNAVLNFLNPNKNMPLPLVEIPEKLNPFYKEGVRIYAKLMNMLPLSNVKSLPAFNMLNNQKGNLENVGNIIENSSGNTVLSLAVIARLIGIENTHAFVSNEILYGKLQLLRLFGVNPIINEEPICPDPSDKTSGIYKAKKIGNKQEWFNAGQYENDFNPQSHERWTAKQIYEQLHGDIQLFCSGLGTTRTMVGCSRFFKKKNKSIKTVGIIRTPNNPIPGVRTKGLLNMIAFDWKKYTDSFEEIGTKESFERSLELIRHGLVVGPSSGFALAGLVKHLTSLKERRGLSKLKNKKGKINAVFICCDSPFPYINEYFEHLGENNFPRIKNEELLLNKNKLAGSISDNKEKNNFSPIETYDLVYGTEKEKVWDLIRKNKKVPIKNNWILLDIRKKKEFEHFHLVGSKNIEYSKFLKNIEKEIKSLKKKKVIVICNLGLKSNYISSLLRKRGIEAYNLKEGITEWSNLNLPRWKPEICFKK